MDLQDVKTLTVILEATFNVLKKGFRIFKKYIFLGDTYFENDNLYLTKLDLSKALLRLKNFKNMRIVKSIRNAIIF